MVVWLVITQKRIAGEILKKKVQLAVNTVVFVFSKKNLEQLSTIRFSAELKPKEKAWEFKEQSWT